MANASSKQLAVLKRLAARTGTTFTYPQSKTQASAEIKRMQKTPTSGRTFAERDLSDPATYATGRFSESTGFGSHASYGRQRADVLGERRAVAALTDRQEQAIIDYQDRTRDETTNESVADAAAYLDRAFEKPADGPTEKQLAYLHVLERRHGLPESHPATKLAASRRIERFTNRVHVAAGVEDLAFAQSLAAAGSPQAIDDGALCANPTGFTRDDDTVQHYCPSNTTVDENPER
jgi:hypothetical protein